MVDRPGLGTLLRHLHELLDADVAAVYTELGLDGFRPRFTPIVRALVAHGPSSIGELADAVSVTHSAASQTVTQMAHDGLVALEPGADARRRIVHLTARTRELLPLLDAEWTATTAAAAAFEAALPYPLSELLLAATRELQRRPFRDRIAEAARGGHAVSPVLLPDGTAVFGLGRRQARPDGPDPEHGLHLGEPGPQDRWRPHWPVRRVDWPDFGVPSDDRDAAAAIVAAYRIARSGRRVEVACDGGTGRTGTVIACLAIVAGVPAADALAWTREHYRPHAVETPEQEAWIGWFAENGMPSDR